MGKWHIVNIGNVKIWKYSLKTMMALTVLWKWLQYGNVTKIICRIMYKRLCAMNRRRKVEKKQKLWKRKAIK